MASKPLVIYGAGGHAKSVAEAALSSGHTIYCFIDDINPLPQGAELFDFPILGELEAIEDPTKFHFALGIGNNHAREQVYRKLENQIPLEAFPPIIHASASVSRFSQVDHGAQILQGASVGANTTIQRFSILNTHAAIDHDSELGAFASLNPGAIAAGHTSIGPRTTIGMHASISDHITVGSGAHVGANSYVNQDVSDNMTVLGSPARIQR